MERRIALPVLLFLLGLFHARSAEADTSAEQFYLSLVDAIDTAKGTVDVYLSEGTWKGRVGGGNVIWCITLTSPIAVTAAGFTLSFPANSLSFQIDN